MIFDYVHGGSDQQITLQRNLDDLRALALRQHDMRDVSNRNTAVTMVGDPAKIPLAIGPTGLAGLTWANGECEAAKAAEAFGIPFCLFHHVDQLDRGCRQGHAQAVLVSARPDEAAPGE